MEYPDKENKNNNSDSGNIVLTITGMAVLLFLTFLLLFDDTPIESVKEPKYAIQNNYEYYTSAIISSKYEEKTNSKYGNNYYFKLQLNNGNDLVESVSVEKFLLFDEGQEIYILFDDTKRNITRFFKDKDKLNTYIKQNEGQFETEINHINEYSTSIKHKEPIGASGIIKNGYKKLMYSIVDGE